MGHTTVHAAEGGVHGRHSISIWFGFPDSSDSKESSCNARSGRSAREGIGYPLQYSWAYLVAQLAKTACNAGDLGSIPGLGRSPGEGKGYPLQYPGLENSMDCIVHGFLKSQTQLSNCTFTFFDLAPYWVGLLLASWFLINKIWVNNDLCLLWWQWRWNEIMQVTCDMGQNGLSEPHSLATYILWNPVLKAYGYALGKSEGTAW